ncbi:amino acid permease C-terminal domain-containing protein [Desulfothermobacter acidiphilus]|uniref:amino acid permease C-terminal domain-containing protein n=1 Tax=Desulfothermobacter acidiphilus TaxID=1938353 RepID=UPI003F8A1882
MVMRTTKPHAKRTFKVPAIGIIAPLGVIGSLALIFSLPLVTILRFTIWMIIGFVIYFGYGIKHSKIQIKG